MVQVDMVALLHLTKLFGPEVARRSRVRKLQERS